MLMETTYRVIFTGQLQPDATLDEVVRKMAELTGNPEEKIRTIFSSGKPVVIKKGVSREDAERYVRRMSAIGMQMNVKKSQAEQPGSNPVSGEEHPPAAARPSDTIRTASDKEAPPAAPDSTEAQRIPGTKPVGVDPNPYAAPKADLGVEQKGAGIFLEEPQKVPAGHGWRWIVDGLALFFREFWKWIAMALVFFVIMVPVSIIPILGNIINSFLSILFVGGFFIGAHSLYQGNGLRFEHLFSGFTQNRNQLLLLGLYYLVGMLLIAVIAMLPVGTAAIFILLGTGFEDPDVMAYLIEEKMGLIMLGVAIGLFLSVPFMMSFWFAPALIAVSGRSCSTALRLSFRGTVRNMLPFLVYGIGLLIFALAFFAAMTALTGALAFFLDEGTYFLAAIVPLLLFLLLGLPLSIGVGLSAYTGFRDIYYRAS